MHRGPRHEEVVLRERFGSRLEKLTMSTRVLDRLVAQDVGTRKRAVDFDGPHALTYRLPSS